MQATQPDPDVGGGRKTKIKIKIATHASMHDKSALGRRHATLARSGLLKCASFRSGKRQRGPAQADRNAISLSLSLTVARADPRPGGSWDETPRFDYPHVKSSRHSLVEWRTTFCVLWVG